MLLLPLFINIIIIGLYFNTDWILLSGFTPGMLFSLLLILYYFFVYFRVIWVIPVNAASIALLSCWITNLNASSFSDLYDIAILICASVLLTFSIIICTSNKQHIYYYFITAQSLLALVLYSSGFSLFGFFSVYIFAYFLVFCSIYSINSLTTKRAAAIGCLYLLVLTLFALNEFYMEKPLWGLHYYSFKTHLSELKQFVNSFSLLFPLNSLFPLDANFVEEAIYNNPNEELHLLHTLHSRKYKELILLPPRGSALGKGRSLVPWTGAEPPFTPAAQEQPSVFWTANSELETLANSQELDIDELENAQLDVPSVSFNEHTPCWRRSSTSSRPQLMLLPHHPYSVTHPFCNILTLHSNSASLNFTRSYGAHTSHALPSDFVKVKMGLHELPVEPFKLAANNMSVDNVQFRFLKEDDICIDI